jgi:hypothetical protein
MNVEGIRSLDELLDSKEGEDASDLAAYRLAIKSGWTQKNALRFFVGSPGLKAAIMLAESISNTKFVQ